MAVKKVKKLSEGKGPVAEKKVTVLPSVANKGTGTSSTSPIPSIYGTLSDYADNYSNKNTGGTSQNVQSNSQYTGTGNTWDANTDYQAIINKAVASGDYVTAAKAEQLRNQKITATGGNYTPTNKYAGWLDNTDYSTIGKNQMVDGASWQDVLDTYNKRYNKANGTEGLQQYANDELQNMMLSYINQQKSLEQYQNMINEYEQAHPKEEYESKYDPQIDKLLNEILNREDFSYDVMNDPLYQQYRDMYMREGDRAMRDTLAEVAAGAGGMNTYAITAAQQANNYYNSQLNDKIPELYQLAYNMYLNDKESKVQDLGILQNMDATQYGRYRDTINDYYNDKNFAFNAYQSAVNQGNWQTNFDYNSKQNNQNFMYNDFWKNKEFDYNDSWNNKEWDANQADKDLANSRYDQETAKNEVWNLIGLGVTPSADLIAKAGMSETDVALAVEAVKAQQAKTGGSSSGGSSGGGTNYKGNGDSNGNNGNGYEGDGFEEITKATDDASGFVSDTADWLTDLLGGGNGNNAKNGDDNDEREKYGGKTLSEWEQWESGSENYQSVDEACKSILMTKGKSEVLAYLKRCIEEGALDIHSYMTLLNKYRG